jgi:glycosyltransferase involved in cell wall biosynthesis
MPAPASLPTPRVLLCFLAPRGLYRAPLFSPQEIFCGPDADDAFAPDGRVLSLRTPVGGYDLADVLKRLPADQQPELLVVKADATGRNLPRNTRLVRGPRVLLVGDTHHLHRPLRTLLSYAAQESFDRIIFDHTRHHAHAFAEAGHSQVHWIPALDYGFSPRLIARQPGRPLTFVGQVGVHHPWRRHVLEAVRAADLPLTLHTGTLSQTADLYADSDVTLNISLNGDLNLRVFEALAAGACLLTDQLAPAAGLDELFTPGEHLDTWRSPGELIAKIRHYLAHPAEARRLRVAGQREILRHHHPDVKLAEFYALVHDGRENPRYALTRDPRFAGAPNTRPASTTATASAAPPAWIAAYESLQELHRAHAAIVLLAPERAQPAYTRWLDLPRLTLATPSAALTADVVQVLAWDADPAGLDDALLAAHAARHAYATGAAAARLAEWGYAPDGHGGLLRLHDESLWCQRALEAGATALVSARLPAALAATGDGATAARLAELAGQLELPELYEKGLRAALSLDRDQPAALIQMATLALDQGQTVSAALLLEEAARLDTIPAAAETARATLIAAHLDDQNVAGYLALTHRAPQLLAEQPRRVLLITNLFPPEELGGYGRMMWEFAHGLIARGHDVRVLTGQAGYLAKSPTPDEAALERRVRRALFLLGEWRDGQVRPIGEKQELVERAAENVRVALAAARAHRADLVLLGNLDLIGQPMLEALLRAGLPVLHTVANAAPGFAAMQQPPDATYWMAPCSRWNGLTLAEAGFAPARMETLYPGARLDRFYRLLLPGTQRLRIAYASLVMPYKGAHVLVDALLRLARAGVDFTAEIAGDTTAPTFLAELRAAVASAGLSDRVRFPGFLDRAGLAALYARSNVLVFPSQFAEPFGISQVEAMAAGLVVVSSGTGGAAEIVRDGEDGLLFPAADPGALAERLLRLAQDQALFARLQSAGQQRALAFSTDSAVHRIELLTAELIAVQALDFGPLPMAVNQ